MHKAGYVNIVGYPNVGKSTLMNALLGDRLSIMTSKPQTTRHRILGIYNDDEYQIVFSDTPGIIDDPAYKMQSAMNQQAMSSLEDADLMILLTDPYDEYDGSEPLLQSLQNRDFPLIIAINKIDISEQERITDIQAHWESIIQADHIMAISALEKIGVPHLLDRIKTFIPESPPYFPKDQLSDKNLRFFVSEIIREKILLQFKKEVPYSCEVIVEEFKERDDDEQNITKIRAAIYVSRKTQKSILIGKGGAAIKKLGIESRKSIEEFLDDNVYLELNVKVKENWRNDDRHLKHFGYQ